MLAATPSLAGMMIFAIVVAWLAARRTYLLVALLWLLIPMLSRLASSVYIDLDGPIYAEQILRDVGPGHSTFLLAVDFAVVLAVFGAVLPRSFPEPRIEPLPGWVSQLGFWTAALLLGAAYLDMLLRGPIPILSGMERYDYARGHAGVLHHVLFRFGDVAALALGCLFVLPTCFGRAPAVRFLVLLLAMLTYAFLTGHRYSAFFKFCTLFALPCAALFAFRSAESRRVEQALKYVLPAALLVGVAAAGMALLAILQSYFTVRYDDSDDVLTSLKARMFVQQAELWWLTHDRVVDQGMWDFGRAFEFLFVNPIDPGRNTSIQYLMHLALGDQALPVLDLNTQFAGGFPEIPHELFGAAGGVLAVGVLSAIPALLLRILLGNITQGRLLTALWAGLVLYPFAIMYWGGMLNFVLAWSFWLKIAGLVGAIFLARVHWPAWSGFSRATA